jgi:hypothetical protein
MDKVQEPSNSNCNTKLTSQETSWATTRNHPTGKSELEDPAAIITVRARNTMTRYRQAHFLGFAREF